MENPNPTPHEEREQDPNLHEVKLHARAARREMFKAAEAWLPPGVVEHQRAARREFLLAMRSLVNAAIDHLDRDEATE